MKYTIRNVIREDGIIGVLSLEQPIGRGYAEWVFTPYRSDDELHYEPYIEQGPDGLFRALTREQYQAKQNHERSGGGGIKVPALTMLAEVDCRCGHGQKDHKNDWEYCGWPECKCRRYEP